MAVPIIIAIPAAKNPYLKACISLIMFKDPSASTTSFLTSPTNGQMN